jgi:predicted O-methyltransferase YrrM
VTHAPTSFDEAFAAAEPLPGWLTRDQARCLYDEAARVPRDGTVVEIGSHHGRSSIVLASALSTARFVAIDPFGAEWRYGGADTEEAFRANVARAGVADRVRVVVARSQAERPGWSDPLDLVYVDGKHDLWSAADDFRWAAHLRPGGRLLVHDAFSSLGVTLAVLAHLLPSRTLRYRDRIGSLAVFERAAPSMGDRWRIACQLPWFVRNLVIKVLLRLRARPVARALGHHDTADPY